MEVARTSETSVDIQLRARQYVPEDSELHALKLGRNVSKILVTYAHSPYSMLHK
jgi:hypothetical protein